MSLTDGDIAAIWLTLRLATTVTILLLIFATPVAWWLARTHSWFKGPISAIVALPLVLPPTVLGFYLLLAMGPNGAVGQFTQAIGLGTLPFTFGGLWWHRWCIRCLLWCSLSKMQLKRLVIDL